MPPQTGALGLSVFQIQGQQLFSGGSYIGTDPSTASAPFPSFGGSISTTFTADGSLLWTNGSFNGGQANFCNLNNVVQGEYTTAVANCNQVAPLVVPGECLIQTSRARYMSADNV